MANIDDILSGHVLLEVEFVDLLHLNGTSYYLCLSIFNNYDGMNDS